MRKISVEWKRVNTVKYKDKKRDGDNLLKRRYDLIQ
jgi:Holliday junction resolvase RusA-like endonuclease